MATRTGGDDDLSGDPRRRSSVEAAHAANLPEANVERAIKKGTGVLARRHHKETIHEGHPPGGAALVIEAATDNESRTATDLRFILSKNGSSMAVSDSVLYQFQRKGCTVPRSLKDEDRLLELMPDAGAEETTTGDAPHVVLTPPDRFHAVADALRPGGIATDCQQSTSTSQTRPLPPPTRQPPPRCSDSTETWTTTTTL